MNNAYKKSGVNYENLDSVKRLAQKAGLQTKNNLPNTYKEISISRGESAYVIEAKDCYYATVIEGLGTKNLIADEFRKATGKTYYNAIAQDTVAMIINDLITVGATPLTVSAYWATGSSDWWKDEKRAKDLIRGWKKACDDAGCTWGGGETPTLNGIIDPKTIELGGSAFGVILPKKRLVLGDRISPGDIIVFFESSGVHANGLSLVRSVVKKIKTGYKSKLSNGKMVGEDILTPTTIYSMLIQSIVNSGVNIHYMVNITGHGWRKLMRYKKPYTYVVDSVPKISPLFSFIKEQAKVDYKEMYATFNMGAGFAIYTDKKDAAKLFTLAKKHGIRAWVGGYVQKGAKQVIIKPLNITYHENELNIR